MQDFKNAVEAAGARTPIVHEILAYPNPKLSQESQLVIPGASLTQKDLTNLLDDMVATMQAHGAVGLAAIQIGVPLRILVIQDKTLKPIRMVNPRLVETYGNSFVDEGCLSFPGTWIRLARPEFAKVEYFDENLEKQALEADGLMARAVQHEIDHLDGKTFLDAVSSVQRSDILRKMKLRSRKVKSFYRKLAAGEL